MKIEDAIFNINDYIKYNEHLLKKQFGDYFFTSLKTVNEYAEKELKTQEVFERSKRADKLFKQGNTSAMFKVMFGQD